MLFTTSGKYGILLDEARDTPRQLITPANSWGFKGSRAFADIPHAFLVTFINGEKSSAIYENAPEINWQKEERVVYNDGYDETNATVFETLDTFGITNPDQAWKYGRYMMAQGIHRSEQFSVSMDIENLAVQRGDLVYVANDVAKMGGISARVVSITGNKILVDQMLTVQPTGYSIRLSSGDIKTGTIVSSTTTNNGTEIVIAEPENLAYILPDDLIVLGITTRVVGKYIVQAINAGPDLSAELLLVKYAPQVYQAETGTIPPWDAEISQDLIDSSSLYVSSLNVTQKFTYVSRRPFAELEAQWTIGGNGYVKSNIYFTIPGEGSVSTFLGSSTGYSFTHVIDLLAKQKLVGIPVEVTVVPLTNGDVPGRSATVTVILEADTTPPQDIKDFSVNVQSETVQMTWGEPTDSDISHYEIRYTPEVILPSWEYSQKLAYVTWGSTTATAGARTGTYFLRAYDTSGNMSNIAQQRTTVVSLPNVEVIQDIDDRLTNWLGLKQNFEVRLVERTVPISEWVSLANVAFMDEVGGGVGDLISSGSWTESAPESTYTFGSIVDFTDIYEVRISSKINVHAEYESGGVAPTELWDCWCEARVTGNIDMISGWETLESQTDLIGTSGSEWSPWRRFMVSDVTAKLIQFRICAKSFDPTVKVVVKDGSVVIDAADRQWSSNNVQLPAGLTTINIDPPFMFDDIAVAISIDGDESPLTSRVSNKNRLSFDIELFDSLTNNPSAGKVDVIVRGQGRERVITI
jgi:hypothetical protein